MYLHSGVAWKRHAVDGSTNVRAAGCAITCIFCYLVTVLIKLLEQPLWSGMWEEGINVRS